MQKTAVAIKKNIQSPVTQVRKVVQNRRQKAAIMRQWAWPSEGEVIGHFSSQSSKNNGIDIAGALGDSVKATADGEVVYSGNGLRGLGNLIIIKHNDEFLSAYAHNSQLLVREGQ